MSYPATVNPRQTPHGVAISMAGRRLDDVSTTQTPLPGPEAALIGLAALVVVITQILWLFGGHLNAMAHEEHTL